VTYDPAIDPALERIELMWQAVRHKGGWCRQDGNWSFGWDRVSYWNGPVTKALWYFTAWLVRVRLTLKCLVCIALDREYHGSGFERYDWPNVAIYNFYGWQSMDFWGTAYNFDVLAVERGWRNWRFAVYSSGTA
jgi:hypothetical protein